MTMSCRPGNVIMAAILRVPLGSHYVVSGACWVLEVDCSPPCMLMWCEPMRPVSDVHTKRLFTGPSRFRVKHRESRSSMIKALKQRGRVEWSIC